MYNFFLILRTGLPKGTDTLLIKSERVDADISFVPFTVPSSLYEIVACFRLKSVSINIRMIRNDRGSF